MPVRNIRSTRPKIIIPTTSDVYAKITIVDDNDVSYTLLDSYGGAVADNQMISAPTVTRAATDKLGTFMFKIANDGGRFLNKFNGGEIIDIFADRTDATTRVFRGKVDNVSYGLNLTDGFYAEITGRDYPEMGDKTITGIEVSVTADISLAGILYEFFSGVTLTFWNGSEWAVATYNAETDAISWSTTVTTFPSTFINMSYQHKKAWNVITEICKRVGLECYMWYDGSKWTIRTFLEGGIINTGESISYGANLINLSDFGTDNNEIYNSITVYGKQESDNILLVKTEENTASQSNLWIKDNIINDSTLETMEKTQEKADYELSQGLITTNRGRITSVCLSSLSPGETISISIPYCNINGSYKAQTITHTFGFPFTTTVDLEQAGPTISQLFIPKVNAEEFVNSISNPNAMKDSYTVFFDEEFTKISHSGTEETDGKLRLSTGETSGIATSEILETDYDVTECEFRRYENFETSLDVYEITNDGGVSWETYDVNNPPHTFTSSGNLLGFRMTLNRSAAGDTSPSYESVCLLYK